MHAIRLPHADYVRDSTNNNDVTALASGPDLRHARLTRTQHPATLALEWTYSKPHPNPKVPTGAVEIIDTASDLQDRLPLSSTTPRNCAAFCTSRSTATAA